MDAVKAGPSEAEELADLLLEDVDDEVEEAYYLAPPLVLTWRKFRKHNLAVISAFVLLILYLLVLFAEFISPHSPHERYVEYAQAPPQRLRFIDSEGKFHLQPFVYGTEQQMDDKFMRTYPPITDQIYPVRLFVRGAPYKMWNFLRTDVHLFGADPEAPLFLLGTDGDGRDLLSRLIFGTRLSLSIGLLGVALSFLLGIIIGGISGYFGGLTDTIVQRFIEILRAFPSLPLWMALSAALPANWSVVRVYFFITLILSILGWTGMARVVRGKFLAVREEAFVKAARLSGASTAWIIRRHLVPSFMSHIIAVATLSVPGMIIGETTLSFLGVGLRSPAISWGVLLQDAQQVQVIIRLPWMLLPAVMVVVAVLAFNFVGDGLRDAADPYL